MPPEARSSADPNSPALLDSVAPGWNRRGYLNFDPRYQPFCFNPKLWSKKARGWRWNTWNSSLPICHALRLTQFPWVMNKWSGRPLDHHLNSSFPRLLWSVPHSFPAIIHAHTNKWAVYTRSCSSEDAKGMLILKLTRKNYTPAVLAYADAFQGSAYTRSLVPPSYTKLTRRFWTWLNWITIKIVVEMYFSPI